MSDKLRRHILGAIVLVLLAGAAAFWFFPPEGMLGKLTEAACWRLGPLALVVWIAYWEILRLPGWVLSVLPFLAAVVVIRPRWLWLAIPLVIALAVLWPRTPAKKRQGSADQ